MKECQKQYRETHAYERREHSKAYYEGHIDTIKKSQKQYRDAHADKIQKSQTQYRKTHADQVKEKNKKYYEKKKMQNGMSEFKLDPNNNIQFKGHNPSNKNRFGDQDIIHFIFQDDNVFICNETQNIQSGKRKRFNFQNYLNHENNTNINYASREEYGAKSQNQEDVKQYYSQKNEYKIEYVKRYRKNHVDEIKECQKKYRKTHTDEIKEYYKKYYKKIKKNLKNTAKRITKNITKCMLIK